MSVLRQDPTSGAWVILAPDRRKRPRAGGAPEEVREDPARCLFCPGREAEMPPEVLRLPADGHEPWQVRVTPNKFAVLSRAGGPGVERREAPLFVERDGTGHHELIVESPHHLRRTSEMRPREVRLVLDCYHARYQAMRGDPAVAYVIVFKNSGPRAGASLVHPHSHLVATPVTPLRMQHRYARARAHHRETGRCLYGDLIETELAAGQRVITETERFVAFCPFASGVPFEAWIAPKQPQPSFGATSIDERAEVGELLRSTLLQLDTALDRPDFNYMLHTAPVADEDEPYYRWHFQILPRIATVAGFELGSGILINTVPPEDAAKVMREVAQP